MIDPIFAKETLGKFVGCGRDGDLLSRFSEVVISAMFLIKARFAL